MGALQSTIDEYNAAKKQRLPAEVLNTMGQATADLKAMGVEDRAMGVGDKVPDFSLPNQNGEMRRFSDIYADSVVVLNVYRGGWCPYCNFEMKALAEALPEIEAQGAKLVGMAPETPDHARDSAARHHLNVEVLSDTGNAVSAKMGLVFEFLNGVRIISVSQMQNESRLVGDQPEFAQRGRIAYQRTVGDVREAVAQVQHNMG